MGHDSRISRLRIEQEKLINLAKRSGGLIEIEEVDAQPGWPPEKYIVTFRCRGIEGIDSSGAPRITERHQVSLYLSRDFPRQEPYLKWMTPIWHPNIEHQEPHHVCTNFVQSWYSSKSLDDLVVELGEMVQYKRYHAVWADPWPLDKDAAEWVRDYAEPKGIVGPDQPLDDRPLRRSYDIRLFGGDNGSTAKERPPAPRKTGKLKLGVKKMTGDLSPAPEPTPEAAPPRRKGMSLGTLARNVICPSCGKENRLRIAEGVSREYFCGNCQSPLSLPEEKKVGSPA